LTGPGGYPGAEALRNTKQRGSGR